jgi:hypothetical protein
MVIENEHVMCTFTYTAVTANVSVTICKQTTPDATGGAFDFDSNIPGFADFDLADNQCVTAILSVATDVDLWVIETARTDWVVDNITCTLGAGDSTISVAQRRIDFDLEAGDVISCTFFNRLLTATATSTLVPPVFVTPVIVQVPVFIPQQPVIVQQAPPAPPPAVVQQRPTVVQAAPVTTLPRAGAGTSGTGTNSLLFAGVLIALMGGGLSYARIKSLR